MADHFVAHLLTMPTAAEPPSELSPDLSAEIESGLDRWERGILGRLQLYEGREKMSLARAYLSDALVLIPALREACKGATPGMLETINSAVTLGTLMGLTETWSASWHYYKSPAGRRQRFKDGASRGGKGRWRNRDTAWIERARERVLKLHAMYPRQSWNQISERVGDVLGKDGRTIRRRTADLRW